MPSRSVFESRLKIPSKFKDTNDRVGSGFLFSDGVRRNTAVFLVGDIPRICLVAKITIALNRRYAHAWGRIAEARIIFFTSVITNASHVRLGWRRARTSVSARPAPVVGCFCCLNANGREIDRCADEFRF